MHMDTMDVIVDVGNGAWESQLCTVGVLPHHGRCLSIGAYDLASTHQYDALKAITPSASVASLLASTAIGTFAYRLAILAA